MIEITKQFLMENRTTNGAWTRKQIQLIGVEWPLKSGWQTTVIGKQIDEETAKAFTDARQDFAKATLKLAAKRQSAK